MRKNIKAIVLIILLAAPLVATSGDLEVTHWWTSSGEASAVKEFADAFNATGNNWTDGAIAGAGGTARAIIISRILGGDPMGATQLNHGRQAEELIAAGLMTDLTELAEREGWKEFINPSSLLDSCTFEGRIYCVPVNIHSSQWLWLSHGAYEVAGIDVPTNWDEFVAAAPKLKEAGILPLAMGQQGWQQSLAFGTITIAVGGLDIYKKVHFERNAEAAAGPEYQAVFEAAEVARELARGSNVQDWNQATHLVITEKAGGQIMGDWVQGEFDMAGLEAGKDYSCLPGLGTNKLLDTGGDAFYFPANDDEETMKAQMDLASLLVSPKVQMAFNLKKGSLPVRGDLDLSSASECMRKGLQILADGEILPSSNQGLSPDSQSQIEDLMSEFWSSKMSAAVAQGAFVAIIADSE